MAREANSALALIVLEIFDCPGVLRGGHSIEGEGSPSGRVDKENKTSLVSMYASFLFK